MLQSALACQVSNRRPQDPLPHSPNNSFYLKLVSFVLKDLLFSKIHFILLDILRICFHSIFLKNWEHVTSEPTSSMITSSSSPCNQTSQVHASCNINTKRTVRIKFLSKNFENWPWGYLWANRAGNSVIVLVYSLATFQHQKICRYVTLFRYYFNSN